MANSCRCHATSWRRDLGYWIIVKVDERYSSVDTVKSLALREVLGESTLQFITQVSYMMRFGSNGWIQIASVTFSFVSIIRTVADFSIYSITSTCTKVKGCMVIVLGTGLKITVWALIFANLRYLLRICHASHQCSRHRSCLLLGTG